MSHPSNTTATRDDGTSDGVLPGGLGTRTSRPPLVDVAVAGPVVLVGATASGKSSVAMEVARRAATAGQRPVEIVAADAMQVYRGMDIGTAKPTAGERAEVPHWCIDLVDPGDRFTVADYLVHHRTAVQQVAATGARPLIVGGTGLYVSAVVDRFEPPGEWLEERRRFERIDDVLRLRQLLDELDPESAARIPPNNRRRLVRALEVTAGSGRPFSSFGPGVASHGPTDHVLIGLRWDRDRLRRRIAERVHQMVAAGLVDEVRRLADGSLRRATTARQAIGYKEILAHLAGETSLEAAIGMVILRTQQLSVAQDKWFRRDPRIRWIDVVEDPVAEATEIVLSALP